MYEFRRNQPEIPAYNVKKPENLINAAKKQMSELNENRHYPFPELVVPVSADRVEIFPS
jgi:hypothetical protein